VLHEVWAKCADETCQAINFQKENKFLDILFQFVLKSERILWIKLSGDYIIQDG
jgi:hypothetical protein